MNTVWVLALYFSGSSVPVNTYDSEDACYIKGRAAVMKHQKELDDSFLGFSCVQAQQPKDLPAPKATKK